MVTEKKRRKRPMFALDLEEPWKGALQEDVLPNYTSEKTMASLARRWIKELISCFLTEDSMREKGLLAPYESMGRPDAVLFAIRRSEELRRKQDVGNPVTTSHSKAQARGRGK